MNTNTLKEREKFLSIVAAVVIVGALLFGLIVNPQLDERKKRTEHMGRLQLKLAKMNGDLLVKDRIDSIYSQIEPLITRNGTDQQEVSLFTRQLSELYSKLNVKIRSVKILPISNETFHRRLSIKMEMSGHIKEILKFIFLIDTEQNLIAIEQFELRATETKDNIQTAFLVSKVVSKKHTG
jgi:hypothetical protein